MVETVKIFVAGEWTEGTGQGAFELRSPGSGDHIADIPIASADDVNRAVLAAREAHDEMRHWSAFERCG